MQNALSASRIKPATSSSITPLKLSIINVMLVSQLRQTKTLTSQNTYAIDLFNPEAFKAKSDFELS